MKYKYRSRLSRNECSVNVPSLRNFFCVFVTQETLNSRKIVTKTRCRFDERTTEEVCNKKKNAAPNNSELHFWMIISNKSFCDGSNFLQDVISRKRFSSSCISGDRLQTPSSQGNRANCCRNCFDWYD